MKYKPLILIFLILISCTNPNYYNSKQFKIKQRKEESIKMYNRVHSVRVGCTPKSMRKSRTKTRAKYTN